MITISFLLYYLLTGDITSFIIKLSNQREMLNMFTLGFIKFFVFMAIIFGAVTIANRVEHGRRLVILAPITFVLLMVVEKLF